MSMSLCRVRCIAIRFLIAYFFCAIGCQGLFFDLVYIKVGGYFVGFDIFTFFLEKLFI